jgi:hypothetical protein
MSAQRPFLAGMILNAGNVIAIVFRPRYGYDIPALMWFGIALQIIGLLLIFRYLFVTCRKKRSLTKAL